jgi:hypothetical protein
VLFTPRQAIAAGQVLLAAVDRAAFAQSTALTVPQSIRFEHAVIIERLTKEAARAGATGVVAQKALIFIKDHFRKRRGIRVSSPRAA